MISKTTQSATETMQQRYDRVTSEMKSKYNIKVRKWRSSSTGCAWEIHYKDGSIQRYIESPQPRGPMSVAIFLHEVGHHAIGLGKYTPRCLEEYYAWAWSLDRMREYNLNITSRVERRVAASLRYAIDKAKRRGLKVVPEPLRAFE